MLPAEEIIGGALNAALTGYLADETAFRSIYAGWSTARVDRAWAAFVDATKRPRVALEFTRADVKIPLYVVALGESSEDTLPAGGMANPLGDLETVTVDVIAQNPTEVHIWERLARACIISAHDLILTYTGCDGVYLANKSPVVPFNGDVLGMEPQHVFCRVLTYRLHSEFQPTKLASLIQADLAASITVIREGYTDTSFDPDVEGAYSFDRDE